MEITYLGHSCFKLKGQAGIVVTDPYNSKVGFSLPSLTADIITLSHEHFDHAEATAVKPTKNRTEPFLIKTAGEYEVGGISVFGVSVYHDDQEGKLRGRNTAFTIFLDDLRVCHLGDLGHTLSEEQVEAIGGVDVLLCPVGGTYTITPSQAVQVIRSLEPSIVVPMHYRTSDHSPEFKELATVEDFCKEYGATPSLQEKLIVEKSRLSEETQVVVLTREQKS